MMERLIRIKLVMSKFYPVFTIVIYWGKNEWKAPTTLKERIECPEEILDIVSDYKFKLIDMARLSDEEIGKFRDDLSLSQGFYLRRETIDLAMWMLSIRRKY